MNEQTTNIRDLKLEDLDSLVRWRRDPAVNRYLSNRLTTIDEAEAWFHRLKANPKIWLKAILADGDVIGYAVIEAIDAKNRKCELALVIGEPGHWGKGIAKSLLKTMLEYAFDTLHMHRVWAAVARGNDRSERLLKTAGFLLEGVMREPLIINDEFTDLLCYSMLEHEYYAAKKKD
jgi:ribosomal-protein-alanine N-acetyltransferase